MIGSNARVLTHTSPTADHAQARPRTGGPKFLAALLNVPGVPFTLAALALAVPAIMANRIWMFGDVFWVLKNGELLVERGALGSSDPFTFAPHVEGAINAQWLAHFVFYGVYRLLGPEGVIGFTALVATATCAFLYHTALRRTGNVAAAALSTGATLPVMMWMLNPRAQLFAFLLFAMTSWLVLGARRRVHTLLALGVIEALWANIHGSFFLAPVFVGVMLCGEAYTVCRAAGWRPVLRHPQLRFLTTAIGIQVLASLATPYGLDLYVYAARLTSNSIVRNYVIEWAPSNIEQGPGIAFFLSAVVTVVLAARAKRGITVTDGLMLAVFGVLGLQAVRNVVWWGLVSAPILAVALSQLSIPRQLWSIGQRASTPRQNLIRAGAILLVVLALSPWARSAHPLLARSAPVSTHELLPPDYPVGAIDYLRSVSLPSRVYVDQPWGAYFDWELWPRYQPLVDASIETHPADVWMDVMAISVGLETWQSKLDAYDVQVLLLNPERQVDLIKAVDRSPVWRRAFTDQYAVVYARAIDMEAAL